MTIMNDIESRSAPKDDEKTVIYRHRIATRVTHWTWAIALFFLLLSGLQIFNAHPELYIGNQSGFEFENSVLSMRAMQAADGTVAGYTTVLGRSFDTTGVFGMSGPADNPSSSWLSGLGDAAILPGSVDGARRAFLLCLVLRCRLSHMVCEQPD